MRLLGRRAFSLSIASASIALAWRPAAALGGIDGPPPWRVVSGLPLRRCPFCGIGTNEGPLVASGELALSECCLGLLLEIFREPDEFSAAQDGDACTRCGEPHGPRVQGPGVVLCESCVHESLPLLRRHWPHYYD
jgi:hypothetical protein